MTRSATVLYVLKRYPRLSETFVAREVLALEESGVRILIDALLPPEAGPRDPVADEVRAVVRYLPRRPRLRDRGDLLAHGRVALRRPARWVAAAWQARRRGEWHRFVQAGLVADRVRREGASHVHAHFATAASEVARDASRLAGVPFSVTAHAKDIFHRDNAPRLRERVGAASVVLTISEFNVAHLRSRLPGVPVVRVANPVPVVGSITPASDGPVLAVARLVAKKGLDTLIDAVAVLAASGDGPRLEIVGGGDLLGALRARADALGISDRVSFLGPLPWPEVDAAYHRCAMVVLPCRVDAEGDRDGIPTILLEALARGLPVISTNIVGIPEVVVHDRTGLLVPPDDAAALAGAIERMCDDPAWAASLGQAGRALVADRFAPAATTKVLRSAFGVAL